MCTFLKNINIVTVFLSFCLDPQTATNHTVNGKDIHSERNMPSTEGTCVCIQGVCARACVCFRERERIEEEGDVEYVFLIINCEDLPVNNA